MPLILMKMFTKSSLTSLMQSVWPFYPNFQPNLLVCSAIGFGNPRYTQSGLVYLERIAFDHCALRVPLLDHANKRTNVANHNISRMEIKPLFVRKQTLILRTTLLYVDIFQWSMRNLISSLANNPRSHHLIYLGNVRDNNGLLRTQELVDTGHKNCSQLFLGCCQDVLTVLRILPVSSF